MWPHGNGEIGSKALLSKEQFCENLGVVMFDKSVEGKKLRKLNLQMEFTCLQVDYTGTITVRGTKFIHMFPSLAKGRPFGGVFMNELLPDITTCYRLYLLVSLRIFHFNHFLIKTRYNFRFIFHLLRNKEK